MSMSKHSYIPPMLITLRPGAVEEYRGEMTQAELAAKAGVSRATVNRIERGHVESVTFAIVNRIALALGRDASLLVTFERPAKGK